MTEIAIVGTGNVGGTLAQKWALKGHTLTLATRDQNDEKVKSLARHLGPTTKIVSLAQAGETAKVIVLATPWEVTEEVVKTLGSLAGKILIDCTNPLKKDLSGLVVGQTTSGAEIVQNLVPQAHVFKAFNTVGFNIMANPEFGGQKAVMMFCGNATNNREIVQGLVQDVGFDPMDVGPLESARLLEPAALLWIASAYKFGMGREFAFTRLTRSNTEI